MMKDQRTLRLLHLIHSAHPQTGGPGEAIRQISPLLLERRWTVTLASMDAPEVAEMAPLPGVAWETSGPGRNGYGWRAGLVRHWQRLAQTHDAVIVHGLWNFPALAGGMAARRAGTPYWVYPHGMLDPWFNRAYPGKMLKKHLTWWWGERVLLGRAREVWFTSPAEQRLAQTSFPAYRVKGRVVPFGVGRPPEPSPEEREAVQACLTAGAATRHLLFLSRLHPKKGLDVLLRLWADPERRPADTILWIAGRGEAAYEAHLHALAGPSGETVRWLGWVNGGVKTAWLSAVDALILPSHQENFGLVVAEALAVGTPVLLTHAVNIAETVVASQAGHAERDDEAGVQQLLSVFQADPEFKPRRREAAQACFRTYFAIAQAATAVDERLRAALEPLSHD